VVDRVRKAGVPARDVFREAQQQVRWHYQWMIVHEFLPKIVGEERFAKLLKEERKFYDWRHEPFIPVEFSVAAYRFGHSQVRPGYEINANFRRPIFAAERGVGPDGLPRDLSGRRRIRPQQKIDWRNFFELDRSERQISKAIDVKLSSPLFKLPFPSGTPEDPKSLAARNLLRHLTFGVPSGQAVACAMNETPLQPEDLDPKIRDALQRLKLDRDTPLWFYILMEADVQREEAKGQPKAGEQPEPGAHLGPVGGRIVGEVLLGLLQGDRLSYLRAGQNWKPDLGADEDFKMADLLRIAGVA
jgi:Animal haem peroxidase